MVISGHTHQPYVCNVPDPNGQPRLVTSASSFGRLFTETDLTYDRRTERHRASVGRRARQHGRHPRRRQGPDRDRADQPYKTLVEPIADKVLGQITADLGQPHAERRRVSRTLGDLIADAQLADPSVVTGGKTPGHRVHEPRRHPRRPASPARERRTSPTRRPSRSSRSTTTSCRWTSPAQQINDVLSQQFGSGQQRRRARRSLQVSLRASTYTYTHGTAPRSCRRSTLNGAPIDTTATYRIVTNNFLSDGGDGFPAFTTGTNKYFGGLDIDAFATYLTAQSPLHPAAARPHHQQA